MPLSLLIACFAVFTGMFLPGYLLAIALRSSQRGLAGVAISLPLLFGLFMGLNTAGIPIRFASVATGLTIVTLVAAACAWRWGERSRWQRPQLSGAECLCLGVIGFSVLLLALRAWQQPLAGFDTLFRWNRLAETIVAHGHFQYYPPRTDAHYLIYTYTDGMAPLVQVGYAWIYLCVGAADPRCTAVFVVGQYIVLLWGVFVLARNLAGRGAAWAALLVAVSSPLLFWSVVMGQETALIANSAVLMLVFLLHERPCKANMIVAGAAAAIAALARDYGGVVFASGFLICLWQGRSLRKTAIYTSAALVLLVSWYIRNLWLTGNPFYSLDVAGLFPVNPVHAAITAAYAEPFGFASNPGLVRGAILRLLLVATLPVFVGLPALAWHGRRLLPVAVLVLAISALWISSVSKTSGGIYYSMRVLAPALALLAVAAGWALISWQRRRLAMLVVGAFALLGILRSTLVPASLLQSPPRHWRQLAFTPRVGGAEYLGVTTALNQKARILTSDLFSPVVLGRDSRVEPIVIWSPQLRFLFDPSVDAESADRQLTLLGIDYVLLVEDNADLPWLRGFPFYRDRLPTWRPVYQHGRVSLLQRPTP
jgi:hypothetical protein